MLKDYSSMSTHTQYTHTCVCVYMHTPAHLLGKLGFHFFSHTLYIEFYFIPPLNLYDVGHERLVMYRNVFLF